MSESLYIASNLTFGYHPGEMVLHDVNFHVNQGEFVALIGPNGAGKSTILKLLAGLHNPVSGEINFRGRSLVNFPGRELARMVAYLPQEDEIHFPFTVGEVVMLGRWPHSGGAFFDSEIDRDAASSAMTMVGIRDWAGRLITELSGGERARVILAKAIATQPLCLLLDEPVSELDLKNQAEAYQLLKTLAINGAGIVVVAHDVGGVSRWADRLVLLSEGKIVADGNPADVLDENLLAEAYGISVKVISDGDDKAVFARSNGGDAS